MASTYVNDLRLNEMATGDQSGSWGTVTNTNLELIGEALGYGTQQVFGSDANATTTVADGAADPARAMYFKVTSAGNLTATRTMTVDPDTVSRLMFIENATSGSQSIAVKQGSGAGAAVTIPTGQTKAVILPGSGSGSIVLDAFAALSVVDLLVDDALTVNGGSIFNQTGEAAPDFRVETNDFDHMFFINGGLNNTAIGFNALPENQGAGLGILTGSGNGGVHLFREDGSFPSADESLGSFGWSGADSSGSLSTADAKITAFANENMAAGDAGTNIQFYTKADGVNQGTAPTRAMVIASTGQVRFEDGSVSLPSISNSGDTNTGIFFPAADTLGFATSGSEVLRFTTANVQLETGIDFITNTASGTTNTRIGTNAGDSIVADNAGVNNVLIGVDAGTALDSGDSNIAIGYRALKTEDDHANNVAIGAFALEQQNAGVDAYNVAIGYNAGSNATTSQSSTYVGGQAGGLGIITGNNNSVFGYLSGYDLTSGNANTLLGAYSGTNLTVGTDNVAVGTSALDLDLGGNKTVAVGRNALGAQTGTTGDMNNVAVGYGAGILVNTGHSNTLLGSGAGGNVTSGDSNIMIGKDIDAASATADGQLNIGGMIFGTGGASASKIGIGTNAPESYSSGADDLVVATSAGTGITIASGTSSSGAIHFSDATSGAGLTMGRIKYDHNADTMNFRSNNDERMTLETNGDLTIEDGNLVVANGHGIDFSATNDGSGSATSELFSDYEEGTFTATLALTTPGNSSFGYSAQVANYVRVGDIVSFRLNIRLNAFTKGTGSGQVLVAGLPYTAFNTGGYASAGLVIRLYGWTFSDTPIASVVDNATYCSLQTMSSNAGAENLADPDSNAMVWLTGTYRVV